MTDRLAEIRAVLERGVPQGFQVALDALDIVQARLAALDAEAKRNESEMLARITVLREGVDVQIAKADAAEARLAACEDDLEGERHEVEALTGRAEKAEARLAALEAEYVEAKDLLKYNQDMLEITDRQRKLLEESIEGYEYEIEELIQRADALAAIEEYDVEIEYDKDGVKAMRAERAANAKADK